MHLKTLMEQYAETERAIEWARQKQKAIKAAISKRIGAEVSGVYPSCSFITVVKPIDGMKARRVDIAPAFESHEMQIDGIDINCFIEVEP